LATVHVLISSCREVYPAGCLRGPRQVGKNILGNRQKGSFCRKGKRNNSCGCFVG
jgi:hypothetical protein